MSTCLTVVDNSCVVTTSGGDTCGWVESYRHRGATVYWEVHRSGVHTASQAFVQDCTVVYGDRRGIANALTVLDAGAVHGL